MERNDTCDQTSHKDASADVPSGRGPCGDGASTGRHRYFGTALEGLRSAAETCGILSVTTLEMSQKPFNKMLSGQIKTAKLSFSVDRIHF